MQRICSLVLFWACMVLTSFDLLAVNYYVSKSGNDNNPGTQSQPFLTISKAASVAVAGDIVNIMEGTYRETVVPTNSGTAGDPIVFQSVAGEKVIITAMEPLYGWTSDGGGRYKTTIDWDLGQSNFVMKGSTALDLARWPNNVDGDRFTLNHVRNDGGSQDEVSVNAFLTDTDIPNWNWSNGGSLMFYGDRLGSGWTTWRAWIKSQSPGRINFDAVKDQSWIVSFHPPGDLGDYYLEGIKEALDYENEWYFDQATKTLFVILPNNAAPANEEVEMRRREKTVDMSSKNYIEFRNLAVFGGGIEMGNNCKLYGVTNLYGSMTRGITPNFNSGANAVNISWGKQNNIIEKCEVGFGDGTGIWDSGTNTLIKNCYVHDFDFLGSYDAPVMIRGQRDAKLINSTVTRGGRDALQIISKGSEVAYNDFSNSNLIADDCALLYTIGANLNMDIHHNWFHDATSRGSLKKAAGIYLDNDAGNVRVSRNVVWNVEWTNIQINWNGTDIDIFNNTLVKADGGTMGAWHKAGTQFTNVKVWNNITDKESSDQGGNQETESTWEPQSDKQNNLINKTSFEDYNGNDFRLKANTPAVDAGRVITGYTNGFSGSAPDVGAYELGDDWVPGINWNKNNGPANICYGLPGEACSVNAVLPGSAATNIAGTYHLKASGRYLFGATPGAAVTDVAGFSTNTQWVLTKKSTGIDEYDIKNLATGGRLELPYGLKGPSAAVTTTSWTGEADHITWRVRSLGSGKYMMVPKHDQVNALDINPSEPNVVHLWGVNANNVNQGFELVPVDISGLPGSAATNIAGTYHLRASERYLFGTTLDKAVTDAAGFSPNTQWVFTKKNTGIDEYDIKNVATGGRLELPNGVKGQGKLVHTTGFTGEADHITWRVRSLGLGRYMMIPKHDQVNALDINPSDPNVVHLWGVNDGNLNQGFELIPVDNSGLPGLAATNIAGTYHLKASERYLFGTTPGEAVTDAASFSSNTQWVFTKKNTGIDEYDIKNVATGGRLELPNGVKGQGKLAHTTGFTGEADHITWRVRSLGLGKYMMIPKHDQVNALDINPTAPNVVHLWGVNADNLNQGFELVPVSSARLGGDTDFGLENINIYPNPSQGNVNIYFGKEIESLDVQIFDVLGQSVYEGNFSNQSQISLDLISAQKGLLMVHLKTDKANFMRKIIVK